MKTTTRIIPKDKIEGLRFGQLLINALCKAGYLEQISLPRDINDEGWGSDEIAYAVTGVDLFYLENDELEEVLQDFLNSY